jgi:hypothetical protein
MQKFFKIRQRFNDEHITDYDETVKIKAVKPEELAATLNLKAQRLQISQLLTLHKSHMVMH